MCWKFDETTQVGGGRGLSFGLLDCVEASLRQRKTKWNEISHETDGDLNSNFSKWPIVYTM